MTDQTPSDTPPRDPSRAKGLLAPIARLRGAREKRGSGARGQVPDQSGADALLAYWSHLRRGPMVPYRADLDPRELRALLPNMLLLERIAPGVARMRVTGAQVSSLLGMDLRGMPLSVLFAHNNRDALCRSIEEVFEGPAALDMVLAAPGPLGREGCTARLSLLPLRDGRGDVTRAVGLLIANRPVTQVSRRFQIKTCETTSLLKLPVPHAKSRPSPLNPVKAPTIRAPYLRLVHSV